MLSPLNCVVLGQCMVSWDRLVELPISHTIKLGLCAQMAGQEEHNFQNMYLAITYISSNICLCGIFTYRSKAALQFAPRAQVLRTMVTVTPFEKYLSKSSRERQASFSSSLRLLTWKPVVPHQCFF